MAVSVYVTGVYRGESAAGFVIDRSRKRPITVVPQDRNVARGGVRYRQVIVTISVEIG